MCYSYWRDAGHGGAGREGENKSLLGAFWAEARDRGGPGAMLSPKAMHMVLSKLAPRAQGTSPGHVTVAWTGGRGEVPGSAGWGSRICPDPGGSQGLLCQSPARPVASLCLSSPSPSSARIQTPHHSPGLPLLLITFHSMPAFSC